MLPGGSAMGGDAVGRSAGVPGPAPAPESRASAVPGGDGRGSGADGGVDVEGEDDAGEDDCGGAAPARVTGSGVTDFAAGGIGVSSARGAS